MYYVYILKSLRNPEKIYVGCTVDIDQRLKIHNDGMHMQGSTMMGSPLQS